MGSNPTAPKKHEKTKNPFLYIRKTPTPPPPSGPPPHAGQRAGGGGGGRGGQGGGPRPEPEPEALRRGGGAGQKKNMKILREKRIRKAYVEGKIEKIATQMVRTRTGEEGGQKGKRYRNICKVTGRGRGVIRGYARQE